MLSLKGTVPLRIRDVFLCICLDCFGVSFLVLESSAVETSAFSRLVVLSVTNCPNYTHQLYRRRQEACICWRMGNFVQDVNNNGVLFWMLASLVS